MSWRDAGQVAAECRQIFTRWDVEKGRGDAALTMEDGISLFLRVGIAQDRIKGVLFVQHGAGMHSAHFQALARLLSARGFLVVIPDLRGHGSSEGARGDISRASLYCEDMGFVLRQLARLGLPLVLVAHSGGVALSLQLLAEMSPPDMAGLAMLTPTLAKDGTMVRRSSGGRNLGTYFRYMMPFAPEADIRFQGGEGNVMDFRLGRFILYKMTGLFGGAPVMTYRPASKNEQPYTYTARGVNGYMTGALDRMLGKVRCPAFLMTGGKDHYVNCDAVRTILPWLLAPQANLTCAHDKRGDHFTSVLLAVPELQKWLDKVVPGEGLAA